MIKITILTLFIRIDRPKRTGKTQIRHLIKVYTVHHSANSFLEFTGGKMEFLKRSLRERVRGVNI